MVCLSIIMTVRAHPSGAGPTEGTGVAGTDVTDWLPEPLDPPPNEPVDPVGPPVLKEKEIVVCCKTRNKLFKYLTTV